MSPRQVVRRDVPDPWLAGVRTRFGPDAVVVRRISHSNPATRAYSVDLDGRAWWVKASPSREHDAELTRWSDVATLLSERYAAPPVVERLAAGPADAAQLRTHLPLLVDLLGRLHGDAELRGAIGDPSTTAGECFRATWVERLTEDLRVIEGRVPDLSDELFARLGHQVARLDEATRHPAFDVVGDSPIHGDLWAANVLVGSDRWWVIDWDDLTVGDPVVDDAILLRAALGDNAEALAEMRPPGEDQERHRFSVAATALALDEVIDSLADWVELPAELVDARGEKLATHRRALTAYDARG